MIVSKELLRKIKAVFGLNEYEGKIWTALLSKGSATAGELADISSVPRSRCYDVLESLEKRGFIIMKLGKPIKYLAIDPAEVVRRVKVNVMNDSKKKIKNLEKVRDTNLFREIEMLHKNGIEHIEHTDLSGALRGRKNMYGHLEFILRNAKKSVVMVTSEEGLKRKLDIFERNFSKLHKKGVKIRVAAPLKDKGLIKNLTKFAQFKNLDKVNARFCLIDGKELLFAVTDDKEVHENYDIGIWTISPIFASALENMFEHTWNKLA